MGVSLNLEVLTLVSTIINIGSDIFAKNAP